LPRGSLSAEEGASPRGKLRTVKASNCTASGAGFGRRPFSDWNFQALVLVFFEIDGGMEVLHARLSSSPQR
jgi:hypothetical protein